MKIPFTRLIPLTSTVQKSRSQLTAVTDNARRTGSLRNGKKRQFLSNYGYELKVIVLQFSVMEHVM